MPDSGKFKDLYLNSALTYPCQGGNPRSARTSGPLVHPRRRPRPIGQWYAGPVPAPPLRPLLPSHEQAARRRARVPAPAVSVAESSAASAAWRPSALVPETGLTPSHPSAPPRNFRDQLAQFLCTFTPTVCAFHLGFGLAGKSGGCWPPCPPVQAPPCSAVVRLGKCPEKSRSNAPSPVASTG